MDVGTITGSFTDYLLQAGAVRVCAIDTGFKPCDLVVVDVSFISLPKLLPVIINWLAREGEILAVIKPQFELGPDVVTRRGVIRNPEKRLAAVVSILQVARSLGLRPQRITRSCLPGATGNEEYFIQLGWNLGERAPAYCVSSQAA